MFYWAKTWAWNSDHLTLFLLASNVLSKAWCQNPISIKEFNQNLKKNILYLTIFNKNWSDDLQLDQQDVNISIDIFMDNMKSTRTCSIKTFHRHCKDDRDMLPTLFKKSKTSYCNQYLTEI